MLRCHPGAVVRRLCTEPERIRAGKRAGLLVDGCRAGGRHHFVYYREYPDDGEEEFEKKAGLRRLSPKDSGIRPVVSWRGGKAKVMRSRTYSS